MHMCDYYLSIYHDFYAFKFNNTYDKIQLGLEVFATTSYVLILISLQPIVLDLRYFKLWILFDQIIYVWNV